MYESFFELNQRPFPAAPLAHRYWPAASIEAARATLARCIDRAEGAGLLIGTSGTGKTLLCYVLAEQFKSRLALALLFSGHLASRRDLLQAILFELGLPYRGLDEGELRLSLIDYLTRGEHCPQGLLLVIDEAHTLPLRLLEEVRMITNVVRRGQPCVRLVLAGDPILEERFAHPKLASFSQRLAARCYLEPLDRGETLEYVRAHVRSAGGDPSRLFPADALQAVHRATDGIPRLINQVCDHALVLAHAAGTRPLTAALVETAWADLQQLPTPWSETAAPRSGAPARQNTGVIEFGSLDDELDSGPTDLHVSVSPDELDDVSAWRSVSNLPIGDDSSLADVATGDAWFADESEAEFGPTEVELIFDDPTAAVDDETSDEVVQHVAIAPSGVATIEQHEVQAPVDNRWAATPLSAGPALYLRPSYEASTLEPVDVPALEHAWRAREAAAAHDQRQQQSTVLPRDLHVTLPVIDRPPVVHHQPSASDDGVVEEILVDHYGTLDAMKVQGKLPGRGPLRFAAARPRPLAYDEPIRTPASISYSAEKTLSLAEALVRQATAVEQTAPVAGQVESVFSLLSAPHGHEALKETWVSLDLLPPDTRDTPAAPAAERAPQPGGELELIIVEDDPPEITVQITPQAAPVKRQEYRQLFARLRKS